MALPQDQIWRHNEAGDLPGRGEDLDGDPFYDLVCANDKRRGFTFTHKDPVRFRTQFEWANQEGFAVNISCDNLGEVDHYRSLGLKIPLTVVIGHNEERRNFKTPGGAQVVVCPAQTTESVTCQTCGLCAVTTRKSVVGFKAHGSSERSVSRRSANVQLPLFK